MQWKPLFQQGCGCLAALLSLTGPWNLQIFRTRNSYTAPLPTIIPLAFGNPIAHALYLQSHYHTSHKLYLELGFAYLNSVWWEGNRCKPSKWSTEPCLEHSVTIPSAKKFCKHSCLKDLLQLTLPCHWGANMLILLSKCHFLWQPNSVYLQHKGGLEAD